MLSPDIQMTKKLKPPSPSNVISAESIIDKHIIPTLVQRLVFAGSCVQPSKHKTFVYHLYNVGPTSKPLGRHCTNGIQMFCVCWSGIA